MSIFGSLIFNTFHTIKIKNKQSCFNMSPRRTTPPRHPPPLPGGWSRGSMDGFKDHGGMLLIRAEEMRTANPHSLLPH